MVEVSRIQSLQTQTTPHRTYFKTMMIMVHVMKERDNSFKSTVGR